VSKRKQDDLTRQRRLNEGCCPTHGIALVQVGIDVDSRGNPTGALVACPRGDCTFQTVPRKGTKLYEAVIESERKMFNA
jgi:hypothetical protein